MTNIKCTVCDGLCGKKQFIRDGWEWISCYLCRGTGKISQKVVDEENRRKILLENMYSESSQEHGDVLYGSGERWGPI
jgi:hypothetical protein